MICKPSAADSSTPACASSSRHSWRSRHPKRPNSLLKGGKQAHAVHSRSSLQHLFMPRTPGIKDITDTGSLGSGNARAAATENHAAFQFPSARLAMTKPSRTRPATIVSAGTKNSAAYLTGATEPWRIWDPANAKQLSSGFIHTLHLVVEASTPTAWHRLLRAS